MKIWYDKVKCTQATNDYIESIIGGLVIKALSAAHQQYCAHLFDNPHTNNKKRLWSLLNNYMLRKNYQSLATLCVDKELKTSPSS